MENYKSMMKLVHEFNITHVPQALRYIKLGQTEDECRDLAEDWAQNERLGKSPTTFTDLKKNLTGDGGSKKSSGKVVGSGDEFIAENEESGNVSTMAGREKAKSKFMNIVE